MFRVECMRVCVHVGTVGTLLCVYVFEREKERVSICVSEYDCMYVPRVVECICVFMHLCACLFLSPCVFMYVHVPVHVHDRVFVGGCMYVYVFCPRVCISLFLCASACLQVSDVPDDPGMPVEPPGSLNLLKYPKCFTSCGA